MTELTILSDCRVERQDFSPTHSGEILFHLCLRLNDIDVGRVALRCGNRHDRSGSSRRISLSSNVELQPLTFPGDQFQRLETTGDVGTGEIVSGPVNINEKKCSEVTIRFVTSDEYGIVLRGRRIVDIEKETPHRSARTDFRYRCLSSPRRVHHISSLRLSGTRFHTRIGTVIGLADEKLHLIDVGGSRLRTPGIICQL